MLRTIDFSHADFLPEPPGSPRVRLGFLRSSNLLGHLQQLGVLAAAIQALACISRSRRRRLWRRSRANNGSDVCGPGDALVKGPGDLLRQRTRQRGSRDRERYSGGNFHGRGCEVEFIRIEVEK